MLIKKLLLVFVVLKCVHSAKILGVFPNPGVSHYILGSKLMKGLAEAGHDVTMISPYKLKDMPKNGTYTDIVLERFDEKFQDMPVSQNLFDFGSQNALSMIQFMYKIFLVYTNDTLRHPEVKKLIQSKAKFDAVIMEQFFNDGLKVFSHIYDCPLILLSSMGPNSWVNPTVGNPTPVSYVGNLFYPDFAEDSIISRAKNLIIQIIEYFAFNNYILKGHDEIVHQLFPNAPSVYDMFTNASLVLLNSHTSLWKAMPVVPNMVEIGGYFIDPPKKLPKDLKDFLDSAKDGAIYFSMGSNLKSKDMPEERKKAILTVLGELKQKVIWKFEEDLPGKPKNVMIKKWCPQQDILAHPNIKLFISHGGLLSTTETVYHGVPMLAIPVFGDQPANAERLVKNGIGLKMAYNDFSEKSLRTLVHELLQNPVYRENAKIRSKVYHDRTQKPMEAANYWVEYVIRHKGAPHLRVAGVKIPWHKYFMVDVFAVLVLTLLVVLYVLRLIFRKLFGRNDSKEHITPSKQHKKMKKH